VGGDGEGLGGIGERGDKRNSRYSSSSSHVGAGGSDGSRASDKGACRVLRVPAATGGEGVGWRLVLGSRVDGARLAAICRHFFSGRNDAGTPLVLADDFLAYKIE
jgi:hypothetical protein